MKTHKSGNARLISYWVVTGLLSLGMFGGGLAQMLHAPWNAQGFIHLGYPLYLMTLLGLWKVLGVIALIIPGRLLLKEWAYAGFFFLMTGAVISHLAAGDGIMGIIFQSIFVLLIVLSWYLRPADRKISLKAQALAEAEVKRYTSGYVNA